MSFFKSNRALLVYLGVLVALTGTVYVIAETPQRSLRSESAHAHPRAPEAHPDAHPEAHVANPDHRLGRTIPSRSRSPMPDGHGGSRVWQQTRDESALVHGFVAQLSSPKVDRISAHLMMQVLATLDSEEAELAVLEVVDSAAAPWVIESALRWLAEREAPHPALIRAYARDAQERLDGPHGEEAAVAYAAMIRAAQAHDEDDPELRSANHRALQQIRDTFYPFENEREERWLTKLLEKDSAISSVPQLSPFGTHQRQVRPNAVIEAMRSLSGASRSEATHGGAAQGEAEGVANNDGPLTYEDQAAPEGPQLL